MSNVGQREILTQQRVIQIFTQELGYDYLGHWKDRTGNSNIEKNLLCKWLKRRGHDAKIVDKAWRELDKAKTISGGKTLYDANREVYGLLRYGVKVRPDVGEQTITVWLIDWKNVANNDFAIAEEVTIAGEHIKRPDIVLYVNGIALGVLELKRSTVSVNEGVRQNLDNQKKDFIRPFFATVQLVMAGNNTEGLRYGVIDTKEKYYLTWKEASPVENPLERALGQLCRKERLLEIIHDFMVFDAGTKKTCRHNQYFGVQAAQEHVKRREGGIIWHTQGSGKSLTMVWLAKWIREQMTNARVLLITDRTELDEQIEKVFKGVDEDIYRAKSGVDLVRALDAGTEWLICSLVHKFGRSEEGDVDAYLQDITGHLPKGFHPKGEIFVFVDECHRTQSGKLHQAMKALLPGALLIGFTGTPLLKKDKQKSIEVFGPYIHTYKYDEAVRDGVVLDLRYEARDIDQNISSQTKIDQWFEIKTRGLNDFAKAQLKQRWGTMQKVLSAQDRLEKIVADILLDMETRDRLQSGRGNALLVSGSIYSACRFFEMFRRTDLAGKCAIITSYKPAPTDIKGEESGEGLTERLRQYEIYRKMLAAHFDEPEETAMYKVEKFEQEVKRRFIEAPGQMKLLIVVDKLLTGFDAPPATYLYIDKQMRDHGLFQAICRVNRLDGEDKEYGYIVDYKDLFKSLEKSMQDYTGEAFDGYDAEDVAGLLKDRLQKARERLEELRESIKALCEPVEPPRDTLAYLRFFGAANSDDQAVLKDNEPKRVALYKLVGTFLRAYANLANEMAEAGYSDAEAKEIRAEVEHYEKVRHEVKLASRDYIDMKMYEPAMRHLLDAYIRAEESEKLSAFDDMTLVELIVERGAEAFELLPKGIRENPEAMAETIENNVRKLIIDEMDVNPKYYGCDRPIGGQDRQRHSQCEKSRLARESIQG
ncbi:MAG: HsdR family type I site-specific deoxyribonuclease, partial [Chloroflexales bacterium]|nr:HsdR family type I site-specific deoxyribonuclease [Chloroflexales bacterium]